MSSSETSEDDPSEVVFVVLDDGLLIHGAYRHGGNAELHARCVGAWVAKVQLLERVPEAVLQQRRRDTEEIEIVLDEIAEE